MKEKSSLEIKHVADLLDMHFHIPSYQRGYRWEAKWVKELVGHSVEATFTAGRTRPVCRRTRESG